MKRILFSILFLALFSAGQVFAASSQFLNDIANIVKIEPGSAEESQGQLILRNCQISISGIGNGTIGAMLIGDEAPGKVGRLIMQDVSLPNMRIKQFGCENLSGNFALMAAIFPLMGQLENQKADPQLLRSLLPALQAILPALQQFHIDRLSMTGVTSQTKEVQATYESFDANDIGIGSCGPALIRNFRVNLGPVVAFTASELGWNQIKLPEIQTLLSLDDSDLESGNLSPQLMDCLKNILLRDCYIKNAQVPMFGVSLAESSINYATQDQIMDISFDLSQLSVPGGLLALLGLPGAPAQINGSASFMARSRLEPQSVTSNQKIAIEASDLFALNAQGFIEASKENLAASDVRIEFVNQGLLAVLPRETIASFLQQAENTLPSLVGPLNALISGKADTLVIQLEDSQNLAGIQITAQ